MKGDKDNLDGVCQTIAGFSRVSTFCLLQRLSPSILWPQVDFLGGRKLMRREWSNAVYHSLRGANQEIV